MGFILAVNLLLSSLVSPPGSPLAGFFILAPAFLFWPLDFLFRVLRIGLQTLEHVVGQGIE